MKKKKTEEGKPYLRMAKRKNRTYYIIEKKVNGKTVHIVSLPDLDTLIEVIAEWKEKQEAEKVTQERDLDFLD